MPGRRPPPRGFVVDANVLIDFAEADATLLALVGQHLGPLRVLLPVLEEVDQLSADDCARLGIDLVDPVLTEHALLAAPSSLSLQDRLCLLEAQAQGLVCLTNDRALRAACTAAGVEVCWGLELLGALVAHRVLDLTAAIAAGRAMHQVNPRHITSALLERFEARLRKPPHPPPPTDPL